MKFKLGDRVKWDSKIYSLWDEVGSRTIAGIIVEVVPPGKRPKLKPVDNCRYSGESYIIAVNSSNKGYFRPPTAILRPI